MIYILGIRKLRPRGPQPPDFVDCRHCGTTYDPTFRLFVCPHPIFHLNRLIGDGAPAPLAKLGETQAERIARAPFVMEEPYWERQQGEPADAFAKFLDYLEMGSGRTLIAIARKWQKNGKTKSNGSKGFAPSNYSQIRKLSERYKWEIRAISFDREQNRIRFAVLADEHKKRVKADLVVIDAGRQIIADEMRDILRDMKRGRRIGIPFDQLVTSYEKLVKLSRLIMDQSTEHIVTEGAEVIRERKLRDAVIAVRRSLEEWRSEHPDAPGDDFAFMQNHYVVWGADFYTIDRKELAAAVLSGYAVDETSTATN